MNINPEIRKEARAQWDLRAGNEFFYKGESFYTITPVPYYVRRREILCQLMAPYLEDAQHVLDFGCGDGWYLEFSARRSQKKCNFYGYDFSKNMTEKARARTSGLANVTVTNESLNYESLTFDSVYSFAVLAHIIDEADIESLFSRVYASLSSGGRLIIFEQTGPKERKWSNGIRRTKDKYLKMAQSNGFMLEALKHVQFPIHRRLFECFIAPLWVRVFVRGGGAPGLLANKSHLYRSISSLLLSLDRHPVVGGDVDSGGNSFFVFKKPKVSKLHSLN